MRNSIGNVLKITTFGESHGHSIGGVIDGIPAGIYIDLDKVQLQLNRRRPGQSDIVSSRNESDKVEFLSGLNDNVTLGSPIGFIIKNLDQISKDYDNLQNVFRPSHADFTYFKKYGIRDYKGGGRSSARETACRVVAGSIASQILEILGINLFAYVCKIGSIRLDSHYSNLNLNNVYSSDVRCPDENISNQMISEIKTVRKDGDSIGGEIFAVAKGVPSGLGEPVFDKLHANIGKAMLSINAVHSFKYGFFNKDISSSKGSDVNDVFLDATGKTKTNFSGGIQGGISNGNDIYFKVGFKPISTIMKKQNSIDSDGNKIDFMSKGRHDSCVVPRAVPIVESMLAIVLLDFYLLSKLNKL